MRTFSIDTNIFSEKKLLALLRKKILEKKINLLISPIVLLEYGFYQELHNKRQKFLLLLKTLKIEIAQVDKKDAIIAIRHSMIYKDDNKGSMYYFRDALIAALSERLHIPILTNNIKNFKGLPRHLKMTSENAIDIIKHL